MSEANEHADLIALFDNLNHHLRTFMKNVEEFIGNHPDLNKPNHSAVHSYKSRLKDREHLRAKISRKMAEGREINGDNLFREITDLTGVRILHLFQDDFQHIDAVIRSKVDEGDWVFAEPPKAYTWDPEAASYFRGFELSVSEKPTSYTSVHYLVRPRANSPLCCEIQVRTLFEEIWGEVDHQINYPTPTESVACREQIKVLSKIVGAGSRLLDSLRRVHHAGE
ncbi:(p)ppGpp synthetase [Aureimonas ureilytica]|uniref:(P)ppGpp synthetase n=1 Tax=Aureimonas ureilytica TaxID=401562 RepID=A0A175RFM5_9HYPH|nr:RelA/SpoT domain-containing protein [Aureimonas ureilytica]KTR02288.1 (p)ppGpp synthetase [Aureimonas ureilytica]